MSWVFALETWEKSQQVNEEVTQEVACIMRPLAMQCFWTASAPEHIY